MEINKYVKQLSKLIKKLEKIYIKNYLLQRTIRDLKIDLYNLEKYFKKVN